MSGMSDAELGDLADQLYEASEDDDLELARLMMDLDRDVAVQLCTSDFTNAAQVYMYAFQEVPDEDLYDLLLLEPSSRLLRGIRIRTVEFADLIMGYERTTKEFFIGVWNGDAFIAAFTGLNAYDSAVQFAKKHCST